MKVVFYDTYKEIIYGDVPRDKMERSYLILDLDTGDVVKSRLDVDKLGEELLEKYRKRHGYYRLKNNFDESLFKL